MSELTTARPDEALTSALGVATEAPTESVSSSIDRPVPNSAGWYDLSGDRIAEAITWGLPALGLIAAARIMTGTGDGSPAGTTGGWVGRTLDALYVAAAYGLAGPVLGSPLPGLGAMVRLPGPASRVDPRIPRGPGGPARHDRDQARGLTCRRRMTKAPTANAIDLLKEQSAADVRRSIQARDWSKASALLEAFSRDHPDESRVSSLSEELQAARVAALRDHSSQLDAARKVNDPERVLDLHREMIPLLEAEARATLEADLSQWFLKLIHKRLRTGKIQTDVAVLAGRIADAFSHTVEGASLRASLPTLRRSAGLCPRCSQPYTGIADACPTCLAAARSADRPAVLPGPSED